MINSLVPSQSHRSLNPANSSSLAASTEAKQTRNAELRSGASASPTLKNEESSLSSAAQRGNVVCQKLNRQYDAEKSNVHAAANNAVDGRHEAPNKYIVHQAGNTFIYGDPHLEALASDIRTANQGKFTDLPLVCAHGNFMKVAVGKGPMSLVTGEEFARDFAERLEKANIPRHLPVLVAICGSGDSRMGDEAICQHIANATGRIVQGSSRGMVYTTNMGRVLKDDNAEWKIFAPKKGPLLIAN
jgi:hypothetical protein